MHRFRRSWSARLTPTAVVLVAAALLLDDVSGGTFRLDWPTLLVAGLGSLALLATVLAYGDLVTLDDDGIRVCNRILARFGLTRFGPGRQQSVRWEAIREITTHAGIRGAETPKALFVHAEDGSRLVLDSLERMDELCRLLDLHTGASGPPSS